MTIDVSNPAALRVIKGASQPLDVIAAWDSGNGPRNLVVITAEPQPDNIYRFDGVGESADPNVTLQSEADAEWLAVLPFLPRLVIETLSTGVMRMRAIYPDGTVDTRNLDPPKPEYGFGATWPARLQARRMVLFEFDANMLARGV